MKRIPVTETIIYSLARLVDDAQVQRREPSHSAIEFQADKAGIKQGDPNKEGSPVGKEKRVRGFLSWAVEFQPIGAEIFVAGLLSQVRACGGFRPDSSNFVGHEAIANLSSALREVSVLLDEGGNLLPIALDNLSDMELSAALKLYIQRAKKGLGDSPLIVGTSKDLLEAVAGHVLQKLWGNYSPQGNFPTLLGQAFTALGMATGAMPVVPGEHPRKKVERNLFDLACSVNSLRNKQGTGHGRPWLPDLTEAEARTALESMGVVAEAMLEKLNEKSRNAASATR